MDATTWLLLFGNKNKRPPDKYDVFIARLALGAVYFTLFLLFAFAVFLFLIINSVERLNAGKRSFIAIGKKTGSLDGWSLKMSLMICKKDASHGD